jgi:hypothetical protein
MCVSDSSVLKCQLLLKKFENKVSRELGPMCCPKETSMEGSTWLLALSGLINENSKLYRKCELLELVCVNGMCDKGVVTSRGA